MDTVQPWMRLKVKTDTFFLPESDGSVYFRNNARSFWLEGQSVQSWVERLLPVLDGQNTLESLTEGLPTPYQNRIYEIADILLQNGYVRDVSSDEAHQLPAAVLAYYAPQIEFVDNVIGSGASRFQAYRDSKTLVVGSGGLMVSLVGSLWESGIASVNVVITDAQATNAHRLNDWAKTFPGPQLRIEVNDISDGVRGPDAWRDTISKMDAVLYVSADGDLEELRRIESICRSEQRLFLSAVCVNGQGIVGPVMWPNQSGFRAASWDGAWRRIHRTVFRNERQGMYASTNGAVLANVLVFELFKAMTGLEQPTGNPHIYTLDLATLQGDWHRFIPGQSLADEREVRTLKTQTLVSQSAVCLTGDLLARFAELTDSTCGVFHVWDEGDLTQLPLAQCRVQPVNPLSQGPADLLGETVSVGLSHEEARLEAGYTGIEYYVRQLAEQTTDNGAFVAIGTGATVDEAVWRGLHQCLINELSQAVKRNAAVIRLVEFTEIDDEKCLYYLQALHDLGVDPVVGVGQELHGFPIVWVGIDGDYVGSVGLCPGMALARTLEFVLQRAVWEPDASREPDGRWVVTTSNCVVSPNAPVSMTVETWHGFDEEHTQLTLALQALERSGTEISVVDAAQDSFLHEYLAGVFGVSIRQGGSR